MAVDAFATLVGVAIGGGIAIVANLLQTQYQDFRLRKAIAGSLAGEIEGLIRGVDRRNYLGGLDAMIQQQQQIQQRLQQLLAAGQHAQAGQPVQVNLPAFAARITFNYFAVFDKVCDKIGLLGDISGEVALLYTLAKGIVEDINGLTEGVQFPSVEAAIRHHVELRNLLSEQMDRGKDLVQRLRELQKARFLWFFE